MYGQNCGDAWGRHEPENERAGASAAGGGEEKPSAGAEGVRRSEIQVAKHAEPVPRKAAIVPYMPVPQTDTGG